MSDLDKKLKEILHTCSNINFGGEDQDSQEDVEFQFYNDAVAQIKAAFAEVGYMPLGTIVIPAREPDNVDIAVGVRTELMFSGQEFLERFEKELENYVNVRSWASSQMVLEAAKKAAGL